MTNIKLCKEVASHLEAIEKENNKQKDETTKVKTEKPKENIMILEDDGGYDE